MYVLVTAYVILPYTFFDRLYKVNYIGPISIMYCNESWHLKNTF